MMWVTELLAVKLAPEEWRNWLEGAEQPFMVWTDHKNLAYIQTAKRLNSRQARWALFFGRLITRSPTIPVLEILNLMQSPPQS